MSTELLNNLSKIGINFLKIFANTNKANAFRGDEKMSKKNKKSRKEVAEKVDKLTQEFADIWDGSNEEINSDVLGSYTGNPTEVDRPIQDADDL